MKVDIEKQWAWLEKVKPGTKIVARNGQEYLRLAEGETDYINHFVVMKTGKLIHYSYLAIESDPPRECGEPSPFKA